MKKLNLKLGNIKEMLSKEQMKKINGGTIDYATCSFGPGDEEYYCDGGYENHQNNVDYCYGDCVSSFGIDCNGCY